MSENRPYPLACPFCNQTFPVEIGISKQAYKDKPSASINITVKDVCEQA